MQSNLIVLSLTNQIANTGKSKYPIGLFCYNSGIFNQSNYCKL